MLVNLVIGNALALLWFCAWLQFPRAERRERLGRPWARPLNGWGGWGGIYAISLCALIAWSWWFGLSTWLRN